MINVFDKTSVLFQAFLVPSTNGEKEKASDGFLWRYYTVFITKQQYRNTLKSRDLRYSVRVQTQGSCIDFSYKMCYYFI